MEFGYWFLGEGQISICVIASYCQPLAETRQLAGGGVWRVYAGASRRVDAARPSLPPPHQQRFPPLGFCIRPRAGVCDIWGRNRRTWSSLA